MGKSDKASKKKPGPSVVSSKANEDGTEQHPIEVSSESSEPEIVNVKETNDNIQEAVEDEDDIILVSEKRKRKSSVGTPPSKKSKVLYDGFCLYVGNLNTSKPFEEVKDSLANFFTTRSLLVNNVRLSHDRKFAYVDFHTEEDLSKALEFNGDELLDKKMKIGKANVKGSTPSATPNTKRQDRTLFVKNIPYSATKEDLQNVFDTALDVRFPGGAKNPSKGIAFVEFKTGAIAERVLKEKQGTKVGGRIIVVDRLGENSNRKASVAMNVLVVNNLPFTTKETALKKLFKKAVAVRLPQTFNQSRGYAFIEFECKHDAKDAMKALQNKEIDGRAMRIDFGLSKVEIPEDEKVLASKLVVLGLAEETSQETLKSAFGGAISAEVKTDMETGVSKGFGFVKFDTPEACKAAKEEMEDCEIDGVKVTVQFADPRPRGARISTARRGRKNRGRRGGKGGPGGKKSGRGGEKVKVKGNVVVKKETKIKVMKEAKLKVKKEAKIKSNKEAKIKVKKEAKIKIKVEKAF